MVTSIDTFGPSAKTCATINPVLFEREKVKGTPCTSNVGNMSKFSISGSHVIKFSPAMVAKTFFLSFVRFTDPPHEPQLLRGGCDCLVSNPADDGRAQGDRIRCA